MPRDYKNAHRSKTRGNKSPSRWRGFFVGFITGTLVTIGLVAAERFELVSLNAGARARPSPHISTAPSAEQPRKPRFEFYTMLPEMEVAVSEEEFEPRGSSSASEVADAEPLAGAYLLQVGSFRHHDEADSLKASLALLGLEASIQTVSINGEETWYRVRLGPFTARAALNDARDRLAENQMEALVLKKRI